MVAHQQRETAVGQRVARGEHRDAVLEVPVRVVREAQPRPRGRAAQDDLTYRIRLIAQHHVERPDTRVVRGLERAEDQRPAEDGLQELGLTG